MKPPPFEYMRPATLSDASRVLAEIGDEAKVLSGGQSLMPLLNMRLAFPRVIVDLNAIEDLDYLRADGDSVRVGALVRQSTFGQASVVRSQISLAAQCVPHIGHFVTRNRGTVAGSIAHADSRSELPIVLSALGGAVTAISQDGERVISASDFFVSEYTTSLTTGEIVTETSWPILGDGWGFGFEEFSLRQGDFALAMVAVAMHVNDGVVDDLRIHAGAVADRPIPITTAADLAVGKELTETLIPEMARAASESVDPADDIHASGEFKRHLVGVLTEKAVRAAWSQTAHD